MLPNEHALWALAKDLTAANRRLNMIDSSNSEFASPHSVARRRTLRAIAMFEGAKGLAALAGIVGVIDLMHHDVRHLAIELIGRFGQNPDGHFASALLHYADLLPGTDLRTLSLLAAFYILLRLSEGYGLWHGRAWGEWLGALSGGLYIPFEIDHLMHRASWISSTVLAGNVIVVGFLAFQLWRQRESNVRLIERLAQSASKTGKDR